MPREITLGEDELSALKSDLQGDKLRGDDKVVAQMIYDKAQQEMSRANRDDVGWFFRWTYRF